MSLASCQSTSLDQKAPLHVWVSLASCQSTSLDQKAPLHVWTSLASCQSTSLDQKAPLHVWTSLASCQSTSLDQKALLHVWMTVDVAGSIWLVAWLAASPPDLLQLNSCSGGLWQRLHAQSLPFLTEC
jgi:hypothetical protein